MSCADHYQHGRQAGDTSFRSVIRAELDGVFLNPLEFASTVLVDGWPVMAVLEDTSQPYATGAGDDLADRSGLGLLENSRTLYLKDGELPYRLQPEQVIKLAVVPDGGCLTSAPDEQPFNVVEAEPWQVINCEIQQGLLVVRLTRVFA